MIKEDRRINVLEKLTTDTIERSIINPPEEKALAANKKQQRQKQLQIARANFAKAQKEKRIEGYREIMDIKGMNKDAAYDSLIAASQAVLQEKVILKVVLKMVV